MKKVIKPKSNGAYALLSNNEYFVYNSKGLHVGVIRNDGDLIITCTQTSQTQLSHVDLKCMADIMIECEVEFALGFSFIH